MTTMSYAPAQPPSPLPRRRRRWPWVLGGFVVMFVALFAIGDRIAVSVAEDKITPLVRQAAENRGAQPEDVSVEIRGFPFLTQVAFAEFGEFHIRMTDIQAEYLRFDELNVTLHNIVVPHDVLTSGDPHNITAEKANGYLVIDPRDIERSSSMNGLKISTKGDRLYAQAPVQFQGVSLTISGEVSAQSQGDQIKLELRNPSAEDASFPVPEETLNQIAQNFGPTINMPDLPFDLTLDHIKASDGKAHLYASARDITLVE